MATLQNFDSEIAKTKQVVEEMRSKIEQSGVVLDQIAKADVTIGAADFDIENARIDDVLKQQKVMEANIADLIIGLEDATNVFGAEFESMTRTPRSVSSSIAHFRRCCSPRSNAPCV